MCVELDLLHLLGRGQERSVFFWVCGVPCVCAWCEWKNTEETSVAFVCGERVWWSWKGSSQGGSDYKELQLKTQFRIGFIRLTRITKSSQLESEKVKLFLIFYFAKRDFFKVFYGSQESILLSNRLIPPVLSDKSTRFSGGLKIPWG